MLAFLAAGKTLTVAADDKIISVEEAAKILNVSSEYVIKLIEEEQLPATESGGAYRLLFYQVANYKKEMKRIQEEALAELTALSQELNLY